MTYTITPKPGDKVRVRLHDGRAVDAFCLFKGSNLVVVDGKCCLAQKHSPRRKNKFEEVDRVRFIYPLELMGKTEVRE